MKTLLFFRSGSWRIGAVPCGRQRRIEFSLLTKNALYRIASKVPEHGFDLRFSPPD
jgi:hypothetical protein